MTMLGISAVAVGCSPIIDQRLNPAPRLAETIQPQVSSRMVHLAKRLTWGATPQIVRDIETQSIDNWIAQQLDYNSIDNWQTDLRLRRFTTLNLNAPDLLSFGRLPDKKFVADELAAATLIRAIYSPRHLYEMMVYFWTNHFNIYHYKNDTYTLKTIDDREVIRLHALGDFGEMLRASAHSPAMLVYLDNIANEKAHPNENYAREIMELHTLGVNGSYTEQDVLAVARCFTGWSVDDRGRFEYKSEWHDEDEKQVLGHTIPANGGKSDGDKVLDILINHPDTAKYIAYKLAQRFVADEPPQTLVNDLASTWHTNTGDIKAMIQRLLSHDLFWDAEPKFKQPLELAVSALRVTNAIYNGRPSLPKRLVTMGQRPFGHPTPDGYPDVALEWQGDLASRWNFALDIASNKQDSVNLPVNQWHQLAQQGDMQQLAQAILLRDLLPNEQAAINNAIGSDTIYHPSQTQDVLALLLSSPAFQWR